MSKGGAKASQWLKSGYGSAEVGLVSMEVMLQVYLLELYVSAGLSPAWAGTALALAVVWDAVSDPVMGVLSDRTSASSARGKRLWYVLLGSPFMAVAFVYLFSPSATGGERSLFWQLLIWYLLLNTAITMVVVPYLALINDLSKDPKDRAGFFGWRLVFSGAGLIVGLAIPPLVAHYAGSSLESGKRQALLENRSESALWISGAGLLATVLAVATVWRAAGNARADTFAGGSKILDAFKSAMSSRGFRMVVAAFVCIAMGRAVNGSLALIFYKGTLQFTDQQVAMALIGLSLTVMAATPLWVRFGDKLGKLRLSVYGSLGLTVLTAVAYPLMPPQSVGPVLFVVVAGGVVASSVVLLEALFSDVVQDDGDASQLSLSGAYYGLWRTATKMARAGGLAVSGLFLWMIGFEEGGGPQTEEVYRSVAWAFGPGVALFFAAGTWVLWQTQKQGIIKEGEQQ
ncbi:MFS transporter [Pelagicoccus sp. SDUM812002]|uniref:MFS transporter n=1 Tax=Pelagicoccus sp. SDUM812002 TaxID=3041266 RepID=UPI00280F9F4F|nr:MFS transporter [Pelagicoccus sp. SDUM812002]MDQ8187024.1 MFS transporter [Pelagicoccus sp. SDUM812002]